MQSFKSRSSIQTPFSLGNGFAFCDRDELHHVNIWPWTIHFPRCYVSFRYKQFYKTANFSISSIPYVIYVIYYIIL